MKTRILVVDDESNALDCRRDTGSPPEQEWSATFASSGQEALAAHARDSYDVLVTDARNAGMDGGQSLSEVTTGYPHVVRILPSEHSDRDAGLRSVGAAHQYPLTSCSPGLLRATAARAGAVRDPLTNNALGKLASGMQTLSLPSRCHEVMEELQSPDASIEKLGRVLAKDTGMSTKIYSWSIRRFMDSPAAFPGLCRQLSSSGWRR